MQNTLTEYRERYDISMDEWAKMMGVSVETASAWENSEALPTTQQLHKICKITGMGASSFLNKDEMREYKHCQRVMSVCLIIAQILCLLFTVYIELVLLQPVPLMSTSLATVILIFLFALPFFGFLLFNFITAGISKWYKRSRVTIGIITILVFLCFCILGILGGVAW